MLAYCKRCKEEHKPVCDKCGSSKGDFRSLHGPCGKCAFPNGVRSRKMKKSVVVIAEDETSSPVGPVGDVPMDSEQWNRFLQKRASIRQHRVPMPGLSRDEHPDPLPSTGENKLRAGRHAGPGNPNFKGGTAAKIAVLGEENDDLIKSAVSEHGSTEAALAQWLLNRAETRHLRTRYKGPDAERELATKLRKAMNGEEKLVNIGLLKAEFCHAVHEVLGVDLIGRLEAHRAAVAGF